MSLKELHDAALKLDPGARAKLAQALLASLEDLPPAEIEQLWAEEARRRDEEIEAGRVSLRPAAAVLQDARSKLP